MLEMIMKKLIAQFLISYSQGYLLNLLNHSYLGNFKVK